MLMSENLTLEKLAQMVGRQAEQLAVLNQRLEDLEDLRDLHEAITSNAGCPLKSWDEAKQELELTDGDLVRAVNVPCQERNVL